MPKPYSQLQLDDYASVAERIELFYLRFPDGRITSKLLSSADHEIVVKAFVYRHAEETLPSATGLASERFGDGDINTHSCLENTETSAIGRALANLGFAASRKRPSREEMEKVDRARNSVAYKVSVLGSASPSGGEPLPQDAILSAIHHDMLLLIERAQALGLSPWRAATIRERVSKGPLLTLKDSVRIERALRSWVLRRSRSRAHSL
jgi:hypothetical protein